MGIQLLFNTYESILKGEASDQEVLDLFGDVLERVEGSYLEPDFRNASDKITRMMAIDKAVHYIHSRDPDLLGFMYPGVEPDMVKDTLDRFSGLEVEVPIRLASRGFFTTFASDEGLTFLHKQAGLTTRTDKDIRKEIREYEKLFKAGIASTAEILTLYRYNGDKKYLDIWKTEHNSREPMVVGGYASVEIVDREGHLIPTEALKKGWDIFMKSFRTRNVQFAHTDLQAGWPLPVWINKYGEIFQSGVDDKGLYLVSEVRSDSSIANKVEKEIEEGTIRSYSIAGSALDKSIEQRGDRTVMIVNELELAEISYCEKPVNQDSHFKILKSFDGTTGVDMKKKDEIETAMTGDPGACNTPVTKVNQIHMQVTKKGLEGLKEWNGLQKKQPPASGPPRPGLVWNPQSHRWINPDKEDRYRELEARSRQNLARLHGPFSKGTVRPKGPRLHGDSIGGVHSPQAGFYGPKTGGVHATGAGFYGPSAERKALDDLRKFVAGGDSTGAMPPVEKTVSKAQEAGMAAFLDWVKLQKEERGKAENVEDLATSLVDEALDDPEVSDIGKKIEHALNSDEHLKLTEEEKKRFVEWCQTPTPLAKWIVPLIGGVLGGMAGGSD